MAHLDVVLPVVSRVPRPAASGYGARLDELLLRLSVNPEQRLEIQTGTERGELPGTERVPEEISQGRGKRFTLGDVSGGEGLFYMHRPNLSARDQTRYWDSTGIDNRKPRPGETAGARLLPAVQVVWADVPAPTNPHLVALPSGELLYANGSVVFRVTAPLELPTRVQEDPHAGTQQIRGLAILGDEVFAALGSDGMAKRSAAGTWSNLASATNPTTGVWAAKKRVLAASNNLFGEINVTTGALTTILTLPVGTAVTSVADAGSVILVAASDGRLYSFTEENSVLVQAGQTAFPGREWPTVVAASLGKVIVGTAERTTSVGRHGRLYAADVGGVEESFTLTNIELLRELPFSNNVGLDFSPTSAVTKRDAIYIGVRGVGVAQVWRYQLATGGLNRDIYFPVEASPLSMVVVNDKIIAGIASDAIRSEHPSQYLTQGWLMSPLADHFTSASKTWALLIADVEIPSGSSVQMYVTTDPSALLDRNDPTWQLIGTLFAGIHHVELPLLGLTGRYISIMVLLSSDGGSTPTALSLTAVGHPREGEIVVTLPVNVSDRVERRNRTPITIPGYGKHLIEELLSREGKPAILELYRPPLVLTGVVESVRHLSIGVGKVTGEGPTAFLTFVGRQNLAVSAPSGTGTLGIGIMGIQPMGM